MKIKYLSNSVAFNTVANFIGHGFNSLAVILVLPLYLKYLGSEAYGLVSFYTTLQIVLQLLDMGITPALSREISLYKAHNISVVKIRNIIFSLEITLLMVGVVIIGTTFFFSKWITVNWLNIENLPLEKASFCISIMGILIAFRWMASVYKSCLSGLEKQVKLNFYNILVTFIRYFVALFILIFISNDLIDFFLFQILASFIELALFKNSLERSIPKSKKTFSIDEIKRILPVSGSFALTSSIWILISQVDKLILPKYLSLKDFGFYSLGTAIAGGILILGAPIGTAIMPRLTILYAKKDLEGFEQLYRKATQLTVVLIGAIFLTIAVNSKEILTTWTGNPSLPQMTSEVLFWYALGNGLLTITAFQYYLQYSIGNLSFYIKINLAMFLTYPLMVFLLAPHGPVLVSKTWFTFQLLSFLIIPALVHKKFMPGLHLNWLFKDVLSILSVAIFIQLLFYHYIQQVSLIGIIGLFIVTIFLSGLSSSVVRESLIGNKINT